MVTHQISHSSWVLLVLQLWSMYVSYILTHTGLRLCPNHCNCSSLYLLCVLCMLSGAAPRSPRQCHYSADGGIPAVRPGADRRGPRCRLPETVWSAAGNVHNKFIVVWAVASFYIFFFSFFLEIRPATAFSSIATILVCLHQFIYMHNVVCSGVVAKQIPKGE